MTERPPGRRAAARRDALIDGLADHVLAHGLGGATLRALAEATGTSDRMLLYYFPDKESLIGAALERIAARMMAMMSAAGAGGPRPRAAVERDLKAMLFTPALWPYMRLWLQLAAEAGQGDAALRAVGERIGRGFLAWGETQVDAPDPAVRAAEAAALLISIEGALVLKAINMGEVAGV